MNLTTRKTKYLSESLTRGQKITKRLLEFKAARQEIADKFFTCLEKEEDETFLEISTSENNEYHNELVDPTVSQLISKQQTFGANEKEDGPKKSNARPPNKANKDKKLAPDLIRREIDYLYFESEMDCPELLEFDVVTRRYIEYCRYSCFSLEDYIAGIIPEEPSQIE